MRFFRKKQQPLVIGSDSDISVEPNFQSSTWKYIEKWAKDRISENRAMNDSPTYDERRTALIRGRNQALSELLELPKRK